MSARKDALDFVLFSLGGTDFVEQVRTFNYRVLDTIEDAKSIKDRHGEEVIVKQVAAFDFELEFDAAGVIKTNLDMAVFTVGGVVLLGDLRSGAVEISTRAPDGSGLADRFQFLNAVGTEIEITGELFIDETTGVTKADLVRTHITDTIANQILAYIVDIDGTSSFSGNALLVNPEHVVDRGENQVYRITLKNRGAPTVAGHSLLTLAATGTAVGAHGTDTGAGAYGDIAAPIDAEDVMITRLRAEFRDSQITRMNGSCSVQGLPIAA